MAGGVGGGLPLGGEGSTEIFNGEWVTEGENVKKLENVASGSGFESA